MFDQNASVFPDEIDIGIKEVIMLPLISLRRRFHRIRLIPVAGIDETDQFTGGFPDAFIHSVIDSLIRFTENLIGNAFCGKPFFILPGNSNRVVF